MLKRCQLTAPVLNQSETEWTLSHASAKLTARHSKTEVSVGFEPNAFEKQCTTVERACNSLSGTLKAAISAERALSKAAADGDIAKIRKASLQLGQLAEALQQASNHAATAWSWSEIDEEKYLQDEYETELIEAASRSGVRIDRLDDRLSAFPALLKILPSQRSIRVDAKRLSALRPSVVAARLVALQSAKPTLNPERFLATLFDAYRQAVGADNLERGTKLVDLYDILTIHPEMRKQYDKNEFTRDLHLLDRSGITTTKQGYELSLPAATGTKSSSGTLTIVGSDGNAHTYYGIRFRKANS